MRNIQTAWICDVVRPSGTHVVVGAQQCIASVAPHSRPMAPTRPDQAAICQGGSRQLIALETRARAEIAPRLLFYSIYGTYQDRRSRYYKMDILYKSSVSTIGRISVHKAQS